MSNIQNRDLKSKIEKANLGHYYINVARSGDKFKFTHIKLTGAEKMFDRDSNFVYCRPLRHSGNREVLKEYFLSIGSKESDIKTYLSDIYAANNFVKMINEYNREIAKMPPTTHKEKIKQTKLTLDFIISSGKQLKELREENARAPTPVARSPTAAASGGPQNLKTRVNSLEEDKVLDITGFNPEKNNGIKTIKKPSRGNKMAVGNTPILKRVYYDFTKPVENGIAALIFLKFNKEKAVKIMNESAQTHKISLDAVAIK
jgi:hypothetical protein